MPAVKIALRVRPLSEREKIEDQSSEGVIEIEDGRTVAITNLKVPTSNAGDSRERIKRFTFDYCFDSTSPSDENYATQEKIFDKIGSEVLQSIAEGRDSCVLAYGQSSSGKTHTMQGTRSQAGLVPRLCEAMLRTTGDEPVQATLSYFEIYNERVRDLLVPDDGSEVFDGIKNLGNARCKDLRVREHPKRGPYVEELSGVQVRSGKELCSAWWGGARRRRTASTASNSRSSRSHALLSIRRDFPLPAVTLTLLDLAGSERPSRDNQSLPRQKEGANINKSLVALANVISALVSGGSKGSGYVPYRDSILTWLLKETLSGGATIVMIATVSPSSSCYSETVNTMRWAARAARIPPALARVQDTPQERALRQLRAEVARLKSLLAAATCASKTQVDDDPGTSTEPVNKDEPNEVSEPTLKQESSSQARLNEGDDSLDSLGSSRISLASMDTLSGNNSNPSTQGSNLNSSQAEDSLFGPRLHRTGSVHDVKPPIPLRSKKRQYSSHEVLNTTTNKPHRSQNQNQTSPKTIKPESKNEKTLKETPKQKVTVTYQPFNKRADIVASVTDRLYSKLKTKKEEEKAQKAQLPLVVEKKTSLSELQICNNARKKLYDLSHRALKASRRYKVVPAETQTEKPSVLRMKEASTDIPKDLNPFVSDGSQKILKSVAIATDAHTTLCKEASVGTINGSIQSNDASVETDKINETHNLIMTRTCGSMTDEIIHLNTISTQTQEIPPRKKHSSFTKYLKVSHDPSTKKSNEKISPTVLNISISHDFNTLDNETDCISDDSLEIDMKSPSNNLPLSIAPPDLLNNHNSNDNCNIELSQTILKSCSTDTKLKDQSNSSTMTEEIASTKHLVESKSIQTADFSRTLANCSDFVDDLHVPLPRIYFNSEYDTDRTMKNLIMGRNKDVYPYNIKPSPIKESYHTKRHSKTVSWKNDIDIRENASTRKSIKSIMKKPTKHSKSNTVPHTTHTFDHTLSSESDAIDSDDINFDDKSDSDPSIEYFKGVYCWGDDSPLIVPRRRKMKYGKRLSHSKDCKQYVEVTSNFLTEATNLVTALTKVSDNICDKKLDSRCEKVSPNCNKELHVADETNIQNVKCANCSRKINDSLVNNEEPLIKETELYTYDETELSDDEKFQQIEKNLLQSLDSLKNCTEKSSEYFHSVNDVYLEKFGRRLTSQTPPVNSHESFSPYKSTRKNPSDYLKELLDIRKNLVESTKRDENIYKSFHV